MKRWNTAEYHHVRYRGGEYKEENVEMMAWKTVKGSYPDTEHVKFRTLAEVTVASCTYKGSYTQITDVYAAVIMIIGWRNQSKLRLISLPNDKFGSE